MKKINIGIITSLRKQLFAYRILFSEHVLSPARVVLEAASLESISSNSLIHEKPELLLLDYRLVFKDTALFFSLLNNRYPNLIVIVLVDQTQLKEAKRCQRFVDAYVAPNIEILQLFTQIRNLTVRAPFMNAH
ncbi:hypothetical protein [Sphingobacterium sp. UBA7038]|uniref:hypothetical protein n=1 Tax=Sphingobacterium TaxID=28453 RepID=UPI000EED5F53|nr:hypothetical protein [Sphingobacterium sp. UBA7038]HAF37271.1 hypothetical protein [Sphingobacterium sp.]